MATTDMQRLVVALEARTAAFEKAMNRANGIANQRARQIESRFAKLNANIGNRMAMIGKGWVAGIAAAFGGREVLRLSESATRIDNALKVAGLSGVELERVYGKLRDSAVANAAPLESLVELYGRAVLVQKELGVTSEQLEVFSDRVALALRVSGKTAQESSGALLQLSQALGSGVVRAEEFNSILEGAPTILQAAARGIKEADGSVAKLRQIMLDGELSSRALFDGFVAGSTLLQERAADMDLTVSQAFQNLNTALVDTAREFNNSTGASQQFAEGINDLARAISDFDVSGFISRIQEAGGAIDRFLTDLGNSEVFARLAEQAMGFRLEVGKPIDVETLDAQKELANLERKVEILRQRIEANKALALDTSDAQAQLDELIKRAASLRATLAGAGSMSGSNYVPGTPGDPNALAGRFSTARSNAVVTPLEQISVNDPQYRVTDPSGDKKKSGSGSRENPFERETRQIRERTVALQAETAAMAGLNPLVDDYGFALEKASATQELLNAAERAGLAITPELRASIDALATGYANASVEAEKLAESQDQIRQTADDMRALGKDVLSGFISDLRQGTSAAEALQNALGKIADKLLDMALTSLFNPGGGGGIGGLFKLFGFADGGYTGPGGKNEPAGIVHKGEVVFSQDDVRRAGGVGAVEAMRKGMAAGPAINVPKIAPSAGSGRQAVHVTVGVDVDSSGNLMPFVASVSEQTTKAGIRQYDGGSVGRLSRDMRRLPRRYSN